MRSRIVGISAAALAVAAGFAFATPASANLAPPGGGGWDHAWYNKTNGAGLYADEHGDVFDICDIAPDGHSAHADISWDDGQYRYAYEITAGGNGHCTQVDASTDKYHDIREGATVTVEIWVGDDSSVGGAGGYYKATFKNDH